MNNVAASLKVYIKQQRPCRHLKMPDSFIQVSLELQDGLILCGLRLCAYFPEDLRIANRRQYCLHLANN